MADPKALAEKILSLVNITPESWSKSMMANIEAVEQELSAALEEAKMEGYKILDHDKFWNAAKNEAYDECAKIVESDEWDSYSGFKPLSVAITDKIRQRKAEVLNAQ